MEALRRNRVLAPANMQENMCINNAKSIVSTKSGLQAPTTKRTALGNINTNIRVQPNVNVVNKIKQNIVSETDKPIKPAVRPITRSYKNIHAKVDTRLSTKVSNGVVKNDENNPKLLRKDENVSLANKAGAITAQLKQTKISNHTSKSLSKENLLPKESEKSHKSEPTIQLNHIFKNESDEKVLPIISNRHTRREAYSTELLDGVEDIDSNDGKSPLLMGIYIKDIYNYLMELELQYPIKKNHLQGQLVVSPKMRATLIDWLVEVHIQFHLTLETLHMTVAIIDRYLQEVKSIKRTQIQLVGITALFIASKYEELYVPDIQDFVYITDYTYTKKEILYCEKVILAELKFSLGRPLPVHFERRFVKAAGANIRDHHLAKYLIDLCLVEYDMAHFRPSEVAAAAVCLSISTLSSNPPDKSWTPTLQYYSGYKMEDLQPIMKKIAKIAISAETAQYKAVFSKYHSSKYGNVSSFPELKEDWIKSFAKDTEDS